MNCTACKQPMKGDEPHKVSDCAEALHRALDAANLQVESLQNDIASCQRQMQEWYDKLQGTDANWAEAEAKLKESNRLNGELTVALRELVAKVHEVNKGTEYLFVFAANHAMGQYSGPQYGEELIRAGRLVKEQESQKRIHDIQPMSASSLERCKKCGMLMLPSGCKCEGR